MIELFIEKSKADISVGFSTLLSYTIDDIRDFGAKNTAFSKTIILPGTKRNNILLGHIFNVNRTTQYNSTVPNVGFNFNAAVSARALIFANNLQVFKGILRLMEIVIDRGNIEYEVTVYGELGGLAASLGANRLTANIKPDGTPNTAADLDFSAYNHTYNLATIVSSWDNAGAGSGYCYPNSDYGTYGRNAAHTAVGKHSWMYKTFRPALFVKEYLEKIFAKAGYTYDFPLLSTSRFKHLIVPHNRKDLTTITDIFCSLYASYGFMSPATILDSGAGLTARFGFPSIASSVFTPDAVPTFKITYTPAGPTSVLLVWNLSIIYYSDWPTTFEVRKNGVALYSQVLPSTGMVTTYISLTQYTGIAASLSATDYLELWMTGPFGHNYNIKMSGGQFTVKSPTPTSVPISLNDSFLINDSLPKNILQKDFLSSIVKLFNLYVYDDPNKLNHVKVEPFVDFFIDGQVTDWSNKLDRSKPVKIKPMSELNARYYNFKFKNDSDFYNDLYQKRYNEGYGTYKYDSGYQFSIESHEVDLIFSPTPLVGYGGEDKVYSTIFKSSAGVEECIDSNIRILQAKKITGVTSWDILQMDGTTVLGSYTNYCYAGHYDDPNVPANDIQFGAPKELFFTLVTGALNINQFNVYWSPYMAEITDVDSKLMTATFRLKRSDIYNLKFSTFVFVDGVLFRLNKIIDYNATSEDTCMVELLKVMNLSYALPPQDNYLLAEDGEILATETAENILLNP